jgi:polysaccharide export outer membrane protein
MLTSKGKFAVLLLTSLGCCCLILAGCTTAGNGVMYEEFTLPRELQKTSLPEYVIEPPDILQLDTISVIPKPPYKIGALDVLLIQAVKTLPNLPISGLYGVQPDGRVNLGVPYGAVEVAGMTLEQATATIEKHLEQFVKGPRASVSLSQSRALQQIRGEHLVGQDGTVNLGVYGSVHVAGLTIREATEAVKALLSQYLQNPEISLLISGYNSKVYYVIVGGGGNGQQVQRFPITGNETVLDAIAQINGLPVGASPCKVWVARPSPAECGSDQILPVDWLAVTNGASTATNYQLLPGDRVHIGPQTLVALNNALAQFIAPVERTFGITLLGTQTVSQIRFFKEFGGLGPNTNFNPFTGIR